MTGVATKHRTPTAPNVLILSSFLSRASTPSAARQDPVRAIGQDDRLGKCRRTPHITLKADEEDPFGLQSALA
jgi:hypothetical protein